MPLTLQDYFPYTIQLSRQAFQRFGLHRLVSEQASHLPLVYTYRRLAALVNRSGLVDGFLSASSLNLYASLLKIYHYLIDELADDGSRTVLLQALGRAGLSADDQELQQSFVQFYDHYLGDKAADAPIKRQQHRTLKELLLLDLASKNRALDQFRYLLDDQELAESCNYRQQMAALSEALRSGPVLPVIGGTLMDVLQAPLAASPDSLAGQLGYIRDEWNNLLPPELLEEVITAFDIQEEEERQRGFGGPGPSEVLQFGTAAVSGGAAGIISGGLSQFHGAGHHAGYEQHEYEAFSPDADWMSNVVMIAKMTHVWLDQLGKQYGYPITRLDQVPDSELDLLARRGFTGLWLIGVWERSVASRRIKQLCGNPDAHASAYSLYDYTVAEDLGGEAAFYNLKQRAWLRGIRLASDMVPNHTGIYSRWVLEHPDWFVQSDYAPFPTYQFNGEDLSHDPQVTLQVEDGYWNKQDAAVVFRMIDRRDGRTRYIYHGNDGTSIPWNDTAQLNYLLPQVREAVMQTILHVARLTPIIRFDAAMTLAKKHYQRLWFPQRGLGGGVPSRAEHAMSRDEFDAVFPTEFWREVVDRVAKEAPDTLLLAEAFWMMEGYFVRTLGMHRVYNSAFMNMLKQEENAKYRHTIKNVLAFNPEILKRFVNFMNNPDEKTAVEQFGSQGKYFGACILLVTMPGLPMFGHGQVEGFHEKYGMEYRRAYWNEPVDQGLVRGHELWIFPLLKKRWLFSGSENFALYDFICHDGSTDENVFAYSNRSGDQRGLVLYNNRHGHTAGWIQGAAPAAAPEDANIPYQLPTLGEALALPDDPCCFVVFRDLISGQEYLRNTAEVHHQGLYAELGEYSCQVFLDFRLLYDDSGQRWQRLADQLGGAGVESVDEALIQLDNRVLIDAFEACLAAIDTMAGKVEQLPELLAAYCAITKQMYPDKLIDLDSVPTLLRAAYDPAVCRSCLRLLRRSGVSHNELPLSQVQRRTALGVLVARQLALPLGEKALSELGLGRSLSTFVYGVNGVTADERRWFVELCSAAAVAWQLWKDSDTDGQLSWLGKNRQLADFLLVHEDRGIIWFNKERFEILVNWLMLCSAFDRSCKPVTGVLPNATVLRELAQSAGYRMREFLSFLEKSGKSC